MTRKIKDLKNWVCWKKSIRKDNKFTKEPKNPHTGKNARANDPSTWGTYAEAVAAQEKYNCDGIGFQLEGSGIVGIDIDHCLAPDNKLNEIASTIVDELDSYTEISPSGKGLHILIESPLLLESGHRNSAIGLEIYTTGRYFTYTEDIFQEHNTIRSLGAEELTRILSPYLKRPLTCDTGITTSSPKECQLTADDETILKKAFHSKNGASIQALYAGELAAYDNDASRADMALVSHLAYWTDNQPEQIDRIFRSSALMRPKWDEKHGQLTYGQMTIEKAISSPVESALAPAPTSEEKISPMVPVSEFKCISPGEYLQSGLFKKAVLDFKQFAGRKTGFSNMDKNTSLYPGLYALGAISSLGKTTFVTQLADQMAETGTDVLFFSFEQSTFELVSKGIARECAKIMRKQKEDILKAPTAIKIRSGFNTPHTIIAQKHYADITRHEWISDCDFNTNVQDIIDQVNRFIAIHTDRQPPVIIIDYLQVIAATGNISTKDNMDSIVRQLKQLQKQTNVTIILISSFNRANYAAPVSFESFKESGGIEYTVDGLWGLQLACIDENELFAKDTKSNDKKRLINEEKGANPRRIELVVLKDRYGRVNEKYFFNYYPHCDYYEPVNKKIKIKTKA